MKEKSTHEISDSKSKEKTPKKKSTQENPGSKSTRKTPKKKSTREIPVSKSKRKIPKENSLLELQKQNSLSEPSKHDLLPEIPIQNLLPETPKQNLLPEPLKFIATKEKPKKRFWEKKAVLILIGIFIVISTMIITSYALFSGSHELYTNKTNALDFCAKCHPEKVTIMNLATNAHTGAGCICHGYNPNATETFNINLAHNLTKNIYCTNCHTNYNTTTGNIMIHSGTIAAPNQSAHYLINNSNKNLIYQNAKGFFNNSTR